MAHLSTGAAIVYEVTVRTYFFIPLSGDPPCWTVKPPTVEATDSVPVKTFLTGPDSCGDNMPIVNLTAITFNATFVRISGEAAGFSSWGFALVELNSTSWTLVAGHKPAPVTVIGGLYAMATKKTMVDERRPAGFEGESRIGRKHRF